MKDIRVYIAEIDGHSEMSRRERENVTVKTLVSRILGDAVSVDHREDGSPVAVGFEGEISISHSRDYVALATHPRMRIGVDIEQPRVQLERVRSKFVAEEEAYDSLDELLHAWTAKEAVYKAAGQSGLSLTEIVVDIKNGVATARGRSYSISFTRHGEAVIATAVESGCRRRRDYSLVP